MNPINRIRTMLSSLLFASLVAVSATTIAQEAVKKPAPVADKQKSSESHVTTDVSVKSVARFDADSNNDGILDSVQSLDTLKRVTIDDTKTSTNSSLQKDLKAGFRNAQVRQSKPRRNNCMDYMMLSPEEKDKVNHRIQQRTGGVFGSRPCDPYVSDMIERPFENEYVELPISPVGTVIQGVIVK